MTRMLSNAEALVCVKMGISAEEFIAAEELGTKAARNSETDDLLTEEERQICERLDLNELEYLQARDEGDENDMTFVMINAMRKDLK